MNSPPEVEANPPQPPKGSQADTPSPKRGRIVIAEDGKEVHVPPLESWADKLDDDDRQTAEAINAAFHVHMSAEDGSGGIAS